MTTITRTDYDSFFSPLPSLKNSEGTWTHDAEGNGDAVRTFPLPCGCVYRGWHGHGDYDWTGAIGCAVEGCTARMHGLAGHEIVDLCPVHEAQLQDLQD